MKNILIVVALQTTPWHRDTYNTMQKEALKSKESVKEILETGFLINGPKSFEIAMSLCRIALEKEIPVAIFEIESVLSVPNQTN